MTKATWYERTIKKIELSELSEGDIRAMRRKLREAINKGVDVDEVRAVCRAIEQHMPRVNDAQAQKGLAWLRRTVFTSTERVRNTATAKQFTSHDIMALTHCTGFNLVGLYDEYDVRGDWLKGLYPIYRCLSPFGWFEYVAYPWQSGQTAEIFRRGA